LYSTIEQERRERQREFHAMVERLNVLEQWYAENVQSKVLEQFTKMEKSLEARRHEADIEARRRERETRAAMEQAAAARERETLARLEEMTATRERAEIRAKEEAGKSKSSVYGPIKIAQMRKEAQAISAGGDIAGAEVKLKEIVIIEKQMAQEKEAEFHWNEDLFKRVEQRSERKPFTAGVLDDAARWTPEEMTANIDSITEDALGDDAATHALVYHFTTLFSLDLIMGGHGLRATPSGQLNGGLSVCLANPTELKWEQWSGNRFRECVGRELWGTKWKDLMLKGKTTGGEIIVADGKDHDKIDYMIVLKVKKDFVTDPKRIVSGRKNVCIIHKKNLDEIDGFHYLAREHIVKVLRVSNPEQEAKATNKDVEQLEEKAEVLKEEREQTVLQQQLQSLDAEHRNLAEGVTNLSSQLDSQLDFAEKVDAKLLAVTKQMETQLEMHHTTIAEEREKLLLEQLEAEQRRLAAEQAEQAAWQELAAEREQEQRKVARQRDELRREKERVEQQGASAVEAARRAEEEKKRVADKKKADERTLAQAREKLQLEQKEAEQRRLAAEQASQQKLAAEREEEQRKVARQRDELRREKERVEQERASAAEATRRAEEEQASNRVVEVPGSATGGAHTDNPKHYKVKGDTLELLAVCWLQVGTTAKSVPAGRYMVQLHQTAGNFDLPTKVLIGAPGAEHPSGFKTCCPEYVLRADKGGMRGVLTLGEVKLKKPSDVMVEQTSTTSGWKSGVIWHKLCLLPLSTSDPKVKQRWDRVVVVATSDRA
jgi:hypothetical protein